MGKRVGVGVMVMGLLAAAASRGDAPPEGALRLVDRVDRVTLYATGAQVTRKGKMKLGEGRWVVTIPDLPTTADPASMRVVLSGPPGSLMHNVQVRTVLGAQEAEKRTRVQRRRIRELEDRRSVVQDRITARNYELELIRAKGGNRKGGDGAKPGDWKDLTDGAEHLGERLHELLAENRNDELSIRGLNEEIAGLNREIALSGSLQRDTTALDIELTTAAAGEVTFSASYVVREASWSCSYDLALNTTGAAPTLDLTLVGQVIQRTGEDWTDARLTVSTERPAFLSVPVPAREDYRVTYRTRKAYNMPMAADGMSVAAPRAMAEPEEAVIPFEGAHAETGAYATRFKVAHAATIKSGSASQRVALLSQSLPCAAGVVIVPAASTIAFLEASTMYKGDQPLIPGAAQLYRDGEYVGAGAVGAVMPGEELRVNFGTDPAVRIARKNLSPAKVERGFWGNAETRRYRFETTLKSGHGAPWTVEVREQMPQSDDPEIRIVAGELSAGLLVDDPEKPGLKRWKLDLESGKSRKLVFEYTVRAPKGRPVANIG